MDNIYDLIEIGKEKQGAYDLIKKIEKFFGEEVVHNIMWDEVHNYRLNVEIDDCKQDDYIKFAISEGYAGRSMAFNYFLNREGKDRIYEILKEMSSFAS